MFRRFASGSAVASIAIAFANLVLLLTPSAIQERVHVVTVVWCFVPAVWGLWAILAPAGWVPQRLPLWGAILGLIAGLTVGFVLNLPSRVVGETVSVVWRGVGVAVIVVFYYLLWMLVRVAHHSLAARTSPA
jgi:hypothetical protein